MARLVAPYIMEYSKKAFSEEIKLILLALGFIQEKNYIKNFSS